jgi:hypothetical protein
LAYDGLAARAAGLPAGRGAAPERLDDYIAEENLSASLMPSSTNSI